jgi:hypothetical protein
MRAGRWVFVALIAAVFLMAVFSSPFFVFGGLHLVLALLLALAYLRALVAILTSRRVDGGSKVAWILVLLLLPVIGLVVWLLFGPKK